MWEASPSLAVQLFDQSPTATVLQLFADATSGATTSEPPQTARAARPVRNRLVLGMMFLLKVGYHRAPPTLNKCGGNLEWAIGTLEAQVDGAVAPMPL
jgi:hypothetical protein